MELSDAKKLFSVEVAPSINGVIADVNFALKLGWKLLSIGHYPESKPYPVTVYILGHTDLDAKTPWDVYNEREKLKEVENT